MTPFFPEFETSRLRLRETHASDAEAVFRVFADPAVTRYHNQPTFTDVGEALQLIAWRRHMFERGWGIRWGVALRDKDQLIGACGFHSWVRECHRAELGYELASPYWRQGLMAEALRAIIPYGFRGMGLNRIEALVLPENAASAGLLLRLGFQEEGLLRQYGYWKGAFHDLRLFSLLKQECRFGMV